MMPGAPRILCRLSLPDQAGDPDTIHTVLQRHLCHARLASVLVHINGRMQSYVLTEGCSGCATQSCAIGCYRELLCRGLRSVWGSAVEMRPITRLAARPYTRHIAIVPGPKAAPLPVDVLSAWPDARLVVGWSASTPRSGPKAKQKHATGSPPTAMITVGATLAVGADGPDPRTMLLENGWTVATRLIDRLRFNERWPDLLFFDGNGRQALRFPGPRTPWPDHVFLLQAEQNEVQQEASTTRESQAR